MSNDKASLSQFLLSDVSTLYGGVHRYLEAINNGDKKEISYIRELKLLAKMEEQQNV